MLKWPAILEHAATLTRSYDTAVTLRQLFYRLVAAELLPNTSSAYKQLSSRTAEARRVGAFPALVDRTRSIHREATFEDPKSAREWLERVYRRDRTERQDASIYLGVEKNGIVAQLESWFGELGLPILALGGYSSQSYVAEVVEDVEAEGREAVLIYAGDFDPSGEDIQRDFLERTSCFDQVVRVALDAEQVIEYELPPQPGKTTDARAASFVERHGRLIQVELDALAPDVLRRLYQEAIDRFWDVSKYEAALDLERQDLEELRAA